MDVDWDMTFIQVHMGPEINHTCPNLSIVVKRDFGGGKGGETQGHRVCECVCRGGGGVLGRWWWLEGGWKAELTGPGLLLCAWSMKLCGACQNGVRSWPQFLIPCRQLATMHCSPHGTAWGAGVGHTGCLTGKRAFQRWCGWFHFFSVGGTGISWPVSCYHVPFEYSVGLGPTEDIKEVEHSPPVEGAQPLVMIADIHTF